MLIGLDVDGVIRNFVEAVRTQYEKVYPDHDLPDEVPEWNISKIYPIGEGIFDFCFKDYPKEVFYEAGAYDGAMDFVNELSAKHEAVIITSQVNAECKFWTMKWLHEHGVLDMVPHVVMVGKGAFRKRNVKVDVLIDDRVKNLEEAEGVGIYGVGIKRTWNVGRFGNLYDGYDEILNELDRFSKVLEKAKERKTYK